MVKEGSAYLPFLRKPRPKNNNSPRQTQKAKPIRRAHLSQYEVTGNFKDEVGYEEDEERDGIPVSDVETEFLVHA
jgi:hypothetical protein